MTAEGWKPGQRQSVPLRGRTVSEIEADAERRGFTAYRLADGTTTRRLGGEWTVTYSGSFHNAAWLQG
jgi:hypothetical protein